MVLWAIISREALLDIIDQHACMKTMVLTLEFLSGQVCFIEHNVWQL